MQRPCREWQPERYVEERAGSRGLSCMSLSKYQLLDKESIQRMEALVAFESLQVRPRWVFLEQMAYPPPWAYRRTRSKGWASCSMGCGSTRLSKCSCHRIHSPLRYGNVLVGSVSVCMPLSFDSVIGSGSCLLGIRTFSTET